MSTFKNLKVSLIALAMVTGFQLATPNKAQAGIILAQPALTGPGVLLFFLGAGVILSGEDVAGGIIGFAGFGLVVLDNDAESVKLDLANKFKTIEPFLLDEITDQIYAKKDQNDPMKEIIFSEDEANQLLALSTTGSIEELDQLKMILTTKSVNTEH